MKISHLKKISSDNVKFENFTFYTQISELFFVEKIILFGSRARGDHDKKSDIDLAIYCPCATETQWSHVLDIVANADTLLPIDCLKLDILPPHSAIKKNIDIEGVSLYEKLTLRS